MSTDASGELPFNAAAACTQSFEDLVRQHGGRLLAVIRRLLAHEEDAREALQDAFLAAFKSLEQFDGRSQFSTWLHRIAVNSALQKLRTRKRKPCRTIDELLPTFLEDGHQTRPAQAWHGTDELAIERQETRQIIQRAIAELPDAYRTVLVLRDIEGLDTDETAAQLGVAVGVVKTRLHRARQALRTLLNPHFCQGAI